MRRRIWLVGTAVAAASLAVGVGMAMAARSSTKASKSTVLRCSVSMSAVPPAGSNTVVQPPLSGVSYGQVHCPGKAFGAGVEASPFMLAADGDTVGTYVEYFGAGSIKGSFDLTPATGQPPSATTFESESFTGTLKVTGGSGIYKGIKGLKGTANLGTFNCTSPDSVHLSCTEKIKVTMP